MLFSGTFERWFGRGRVWTRGHATPDTVRRSEFTRAVPRDDELPGVDLDALLEVHAVHVHRIRTAYGGEAGSFEAQLAPLIARFAAFVHLLPVTRDAHFREPGGCLRCGLEVGFHALQVAEGQIFSAGGTVQARRAVGPRWRAAAFALGLCSEVHRPVFGSLVCAETGAAWQPMLMPLTEWLQQGRRDRYRVQWSDASVPQRAATLAILPQVLGAPFLALLADPDRTVLHQMLDALAAPVGARQNVLASIVDQTLARVVARELRRAGVPRTGAPAGWAGGGASPDDAPLAEAPVAPGSQPTPIPPASSIEDGSTVVAPRPGSPEAPPAEESECDRRPAGPRLDPSAPVRARRRVSIPATLNPVVAEAVATLLSLPADEALAKGIDITEAGIFVPLQVWVHRGLDTGLVVKALHETHLLVLQGARKVWRRRCGDEDVPGLMVNARVLA